MTKCRRALCETNRMQPPQEQEIRRQVERICASARLKDAGRSRRFLSFIVEEALAGRSADLKENIVGVHVFDREADYDPRLNSIVRVEAGRLRTKLNDYYEQEGRDDQVVVVLPKGSYAPEFTWRERKQAVSTPAIASSTPVNPIHVRSTRRALLTAAAAVLALTAGVAVTAHLFGRPTAPDLRIAVLPFTPYSNDARDRMIADQLTQKVTAEFVKLGTYNVVPSTSARRYEDRRPSVREIAESLRADILLEARATTEGDQVRVEVRLSDGALDRKFWVGDEFSGDDIDDLAKQIAFATSRAASVSRHIQ